MATSSWQLIRYDIKDISRVLFQKTWLRHLLLLRAKLKLFWIELRLNYNGEVQEHDPWLRQDSEAMLCMTGEEIAHYLNNLSRITSEVEKKDPLLKELELSSLGKQIL